MSWSSSLFQYIKDNQPISITGLIPHSIRWLFARPSVYLNPNFKPEGPLDKGVDIYCLHGIADRPSAFTVMLEHMIENKILPDFIYKVHLVGFDERRKTIPEYAEKLKNQIIQNGNMDAKPHNNVILFGHSRGGLVSAYFAEFFAKEANINVHGVFPFGMPGEGSWAASIPLISYLSPSIPEMTKDSALLKELGEKFKVSQVPYFPYAAENDMLVAASMNIMKEKWQLKIMKRHGHLSLLSSWKMLDDMKPILAGMWKPASLVSILPPQDSPEYLCARISYDYQGLTTHADGIQQCVCDQIQDEITRLKTSYYWQSANAKIEALSRLHKMLTEMLTSHVNHDYPEASTIGDFIFDFLHDDKTNLRKPIDVLSVPLKGCFSTEYTASSTFASDLVETYKYAPLTVDNMQHSRFNKLIAEVSERAVEQAVMKSVEKAVEKTNISKAI